MNELKLIKKMLAEKADIYETPLHIYKESKEKYYVEIKSAMNGLGISDAQYDILNIMEKRPFSLIGWHFEQSKDKMGILTIKFEVDQKVLEIMKDISYCENHIRKMQKVKENLEKML